MRAHLATLLDDFRRFDRDIAVVHSRGNRRCAMRYGELAGLAGRFAALLEERGIGTGDRVVLWAENSASGLRPSTAACCAAFSSSLWMPTAARSSRSA
ncbi:MAG TPA: hypothetical protein VF392_04955 [Terracidiphilus sp.]